MEPDDTIDTICGKESWSQFDIDCLKALTQQFPDDPYLWVTLGDISQIADCSAIGNEYALGCYLNAIAADPCYDPAHISLGHWYDIAEDFPKAEHHFKIAIKLGVGDSARIGLAQVLAQIGRDDEASTLLDGCDEPDAEQVVQLRRKMAEELLEPDVDQ